jgi:D-alanine-D-alanine ligase-like ATP-grasp enzyme
LKELEDIFAKYEENKIRVAMVEEPVEMPDYRIVTLDGEAISAYRRLPLSVVGNGKDSVGRLLDILQADFIEQGRDTKIIVDDLRILDHLNKQGKDLNYIPDEDDRLVLADISNLSAGGTSEDVTETVAPEWIDLAAMIASNFNLRLCGVDIACEDISDGDAAYSILEVNAAPGLDHYASSGEKQENIVRSLYAKVFNTSPVR